MDMKKQVIIIIAFILLILGNIFLINKVINQNNKFDQYELSIKALNDTVSHQAYKGKDVYSQLMVQMTLNDLLKSEYFKTLATDKQEFYKEINKIKGLIAASQATLSLTGNINDTTSIVKNDTIQFSDTTKFFKYNATVYLKKPFRLSLNYKYEPSILTTFERQNDKTILVKYTIDDPNLKVKQISNFIIPIEEDKRGPIAKWLNKNKWPIIGVSATSVFIGGIYIGSKL